MKNPVLKMMLNSWIAHPTKGLDKCFFDCSHEQYNSIPESGSLRFRWCGEVAMYVSLIVEDLNKEFNSVNFEFVQLTSGKDSLIPRVRQWIEEKDSITEFYKVDLFDKFINKVARETPDDSVNLKSCCFGEKESEMGRFAFITGNRIGRCGTVSFESRGKIYVPDDYDRMVFFSKNLLGTRTRVTCLELKEIWDHFSEIREAKILEEKKRKEEEAERERLREESLDDFLKF